MTFWRSASKQRLAMLDHIALMRFVLAECGQTEHALFGELSEKARLLSEEVEVSTIEMARRLVEIEEAMRAEFPSQFELDLSGSLNVYRGIGHTECRRDSTARMARRQEVIATLAASNGRGLARAVLSKEPC